MARSKRSQVAKVVWIVVQGKTTFSLFWSQSVEPGHRNPFRWLKINQEAENETVSMKYWVIPCSGNCPKFQNCKEFYSAVTRVWKPKCYYVISSLNAAFTLLALMRVSWVEETEIHAAQCTNKQFEHFNIVLLLLMSYFYLFLLSKALKMSSNHLFNRATVGGNYSDGDFTIATYNVLADYHIPNHSLYQKPETTPKLYRYCPPDHLYKKIHGRKSSRHLLLINEVGNNFLSDLIGLFLDGLYLLTQHI